MYRWMKRSRSPWDSRLHSSHPQRSRPPPSPWLVGKGVLRQFGSRQYTWTGRELGEWVVSAINTQTAAAFTNGSLHLHPKCNTLGTACSCEHGIRSLVAYAFTTKNNRPRTKLSAHSSNEFFVSANRLRTTLRPFFSMNALFCSFTSVTKEVYVLQLI